jgi:hypothetical protein
MYLYEKGGRAGSAWELSKQEIFCISPQNIYVCRCSLLPTFCSVFRLQCIKAQASEPGNHWFWLSSLSVSVVYSIWKHLITTFKFRSMQTLSWSQACRTLLLQQWAESVSVELRYFGSELNRFLYNCVTSEMGWTGFCACTLSSELYWSFLPLHN